MLAKILFLTVFHLHKNALVGQTFDLRYFSNFIAITCLSLYCVICMRQATKYEKINLFQRGSFLALNARSPLALIGQAVFENGG